MSMHALVKINTYFYIFLNGLITLVKRVLEVNQFRIKEQEVLSVLVNAMTYAASDFILK